MKFSFILYTALILSSPVFAAPKWNWRYSTVTQAEATKNTSPQQNLNTSTEPSKVTQQNKVSNTISYPDDTSDYIEEDNNDDFEPSDAFANLADDNIAMLKENDFDKADINHDDLIDEDELLQFQTDNFNTVVKQTFEQLDSNQDTLISPEEITTYYGKQNSDSDVLPSILERFNNNDLDKDGFLDNTELYYFLQKDMLNNNKMIFQLFDIDHDGHITRDEMSQITDLFKNIYQ